MNETLQVIHRRRSIRKYKPEQIKDAELQLLLDAALLAPNGLNLQKWHFTVIQNQDVMDRMVSAIKEGIISADIQHLAKIAATPDYHTFYHAPTVILISGDEQWHISDIDCALAAENIVLAAESLNIGSCIITSSAFMFNGEQGKAFKQELGVPEGYKHVCTIAIGYKDIENPTAPSRKTNVINYIK